MPTYLVHGFRWIRHSIRIHIIMQDLEDAAAEWIIAPTTSITFLNNFYSIFDFLPPSNPPPPIIDSVDAPLDKVVVVKQGNRERSTSRSLRGLRRIGSSLLLRSKDKKGTGAREDKQEKDAKDEEQSQRPKTSATTSERTSVTTNESRRSTNKELAFNDWSAVKLLEQYDPDNLETVSQPYAYVADYIVKISLCASITKETEKYEARLKAEEEAIIGAASPTADSNSEGSKSPTGSLALGRRAKRLRWIEKLRDGLEKDAEVGWYVVVCGDEERAVPDAASISQVAASIEEEREEMVEEVADPQKTPTRTGLKRFFSRQNLRQQAS